MVLNHKQAKNSPEQALNEKISDAYSCIIFLAPSKASRLSPDAKVR